MLQEFLKIIKSDVSKQHVKKQLKRRRQQKKENQPLRVRISYLRSPSSLPKKISTSLSSKKNEEVEMDARDTIGGLGGGLAQAALGHPLDTVKVLVQTGRYAGMSEAVRGILSQSGPLGFYKGVSSPLAGLLLLNATVFTSFGAAKRWVSEYHHYASVSELSVMDHFMCGAFSGVCISAIESPVELFKNQLQVRGAHFKGFFDCANQIVRGRGLQGAYQGLSATLLRNIPANASWYGVYHWMREVQRSNDGQPLASWQVMLAGSVAGISYWVSSYPCDIIKTTIQSDDPFHRSIQTTQQAAQHIYKTQGVKGFFRGITPCLLRAIPASGCTFLAYEQAVSLWDSIVTKK